MFCPNNLWIDTNIEKYWLSIDNVTVSPDGYERQALTVNGSVPGPTIIADWGDNVIIHVTNNLATNGLVVNLKPRNFS